MIRYLFIAHRTQAPRPSSGAQTPDLTYRLPGFSFA